MMLGVTDGVEVEILSLPCQLDHFFEHLLDLVCAMRDRGELFAFLRGSWYGGDKVIHEFHESSL
jgi:hypothetical protein